MFHRRVFENYSHCYRGYPHETEKTENYRCQCYIAQRFHDFSVVYDEKREYAGIDPYQTSRQC